MADGICGEERAAMKQHQDVAHWDVPTRAPTVGADVAVPLCQAVASGVLVGVPLGGALAYLARLPWWLAGIGAVLVAGCVWMLLLRDHRRLLWQTERTTGRDLDGDHQIGQPAAPPPLRLELDSTDQDGYHGQILHIDAVTPDQLATFARAVREGRSMALDTWTGKGRLFTRTQYANVMDEMTAAGLVVKSSGNTGRRLTAKGRAVFRGLADG